MLQINCVYESNNSAFGHKRSLEDIRHARGQKIDSEPENGTFRLGRPRTQKAQEDFFARQKCHICVQHAANTCGVLLVYLRIHTYIYIYVCMYV